MAPDPNSFLLVFEVTGLDGSMVGPILDKAAGDEELSEEEQMVWDANFYGGQTALKVTALVPLTMAVCYLILIVVFRRKGGYTAIELDTSEESPESAPA